MIRGSIKKKKKLGQNINLYIAVNKIEELFKERGRVRRQLFENVVVAGVFAAVLASWSSVQRIVQFTGYFRMEQFAETGDFVPLWKTTCARKRYKSGCPVQNSFRLTRHSVKSSILVSASGHQSNTSSMKGIPDPVEVVVRPASATLADNGKPDGVDLTKARMTATQSLARASYVSVDCAYFDKYYARIYIYIAMIRRRRNAHFKRFGLIN